MQSKKTIKNKKLGIDLSYPFYILLFAFYPIFFIYTNNLQEVYLEETLIPLGISIAVTTIFFFILNLFIKNIYKTSLIVFLALIIFFSYGHVFDLVEGAKIFGIQVGRNKFLLPGSLFLFIFFSFLILKTKLALPGLSKYLNIAGIVLILISLFTLINFSIKNGLKIRESDSVHTQYREASSKLPDIYYIILDGYARADTLKKLDHFDNSKFINFLEKRGFYVADKSQSNYSLTLLSLSSTLNMQYLDALVSKNTTDAKKRDAGIEMIRNNKVANSLRQGGYKILNIGTGWGATDKNPYADQVFHYRQRSEFTKLLYQTSILLSLERFQVGDADSVLFAFEKLSEIPEMQEPTFTFTHIVSPHPPYLFDRDGNKLAIYSKSFNEPAAWEEREKYIDQLIFINKKMQSTVESILSKSKIEPIIIIQGDHGTGSLGSTPLQKVSLKKLKERMRNLNAYYLPNGGDKQLYESITPVNTFRTIFNFYFDKNFEILPDKSYYSQYINYFKFIEVPQDL